MSEDRMIETISEDIMNETMSEDIMNKTMSEDILNEPMSKDIMNEPMSEDIMNEPMSEDIMNEPMSEDTNIKIFLNELSRIPCCTTYPPQSPARVEYSDYKLKQIIIYNFNISCFLAEILVSNFTKYEKLKYEDLKLTNIF